ncbi:MAG: ATP-binding protein [Simkaniaceae bacterium]|nr:ATP-binding protein [Simkaniaceae bacterium]
MQAWENFLDSEEKIFGKAAVDKWLRTLVVSQFDACNLHLQARDPFHLHWFEEHMRPKVEKALFNNNGRRIKVHINLGEAVPDPTLKETKVEEKKNLFASDSLESHCTLAQFVHGKQSKIPYQILCELVGYQSETNKFTTPNLKMGEINPIYISGPSGVGKTHLLMAITATLRNRGLKAHFVHADRFSEHVVTAFRSSLVEPFRATYRNLDALIIDDIHRFQRKSATQEEFFHTFNALHTRGVQIIISANVPPRELRDIEERLISRCEWGISLTIGKLSTDELKEIALRRAQMLQFPLSDSIINYLVTSFKSHKSLTRAIEALVLRTHIDRRKEPLDLEAVKTYLKDLTEKEEEQGISPGKILQGVAQKFGIRIDDILGKSRSRDCALPRQIAMYLCRQELKMPYIKIGDLFSRDHSTVMSSVKLIADSVEKREADITSSITEIQRLCC